jgi:hypothetical protein
VPLSAPQFQALVAALATDLASMTAVQKVDLVGGHCLHFHPRVPGTSTVLPESVDGNPQDQEVVNCTECNDEITVTGTPWYVAVPRWVWGFLVNTLTWGRTGGDGQSGEGAGPADSGTPDDEPCDAECERRREERAECLSGRVNSCGDRCGNEADCRACCLRQANNSLEGCGEVSTAHTLGGLAEFGTSRPTLPTVSPDSLGTCETGLNNAFMFTCKRACPTAGVH